MLKLNLFAISSVALVSSSLMAQSHSMIDQSRSSLRKNVFITQAVEGEFGTMEMTCKDGDVTSENWKGYGIRNGVGVEVFKFVQLSLSHTLLNLRSNESSLENLNGSRVSAELGFSFSAPLTNIQFGLGALASQMQYQDYEKSSTFVGAGHYYTMGINYFFSSSLSLQITGKKFETNHKASGGSTNLDTITSKTDNLSLGVAIWL